MEIKKNVKVRLFLIFIISMSYNAQSQNHSSALDVLGGYVPDGFAGMINYNYYITRYNFVQGSVFYSSHIIEKEGIDIPYSTLTFNIGYMLSVKTSKNQNVKLNIGFGGLAGYEIINNGNDTLENGALLMDKSKFLYGGYLSAELSIYLSDSFNLIFKGNEYYHHNSDLGEFTLFAGAGLRYFLF